MDQFRKTEKAAYELKELAEQLWLSLSRRCQTAQSFSDRYSMLQTAVVTRFLGDTFRQEHDAVGGPQDLHDFEAEENGIK